MPLIRVLAENGTSDRPVQVALAQPEALLGEHDDRAALGRLVGEAGELGGVGELEVGDAGRRDERPSPGGCRA